MKVHVIPMRSAGVEVPRKMLNDRCTVRHSGDLVMMEVTDQGLRRPVKVARLITSHPKLAPIELVDPHILWINADRFVLAGFESKRNAMGERVDYAQSWLCALDKPLGVVDDKRASLREKVPPR